MTKRAAYERIQMEPLRMIVAKAMWEGGEGADMKPPVKWDRLAPDEKEYWAKVADVAIATIRKIVCQPEYERWSRSDDDGAVFALGAVGNIVSHLVMGKKAETQRAAEALAVRSN